MQTKPHHMQILLKTRRVKEKQSNETNAKQNDASEISRVDECHYTKVGMEGDSNTSAVDDVLQEESLIWDSQYLKLLGGYVCKA